MRRAAAKFAVVAAALLAGAPLAACGFQPLYEQPTVSGLTHIEVDAPQGRIGYLLGQDVESALGRAAGEAPIYRLNVALVQTRAAHGLTANATAQRYELDMKVTYTLIEIATGKVVKTGAVISNISYDSLNAPYAGIAARQDVQDRLALDAAQKIEVAIAAWMASRPTS
jgi:LPS-assembly lipoprotein